MTTSSDEAVDKVAESLRILAERIEDYETLIRRYEAKLEQLERWEEHLVNAARKVSIERDDLKKYPVGKGWVLKSPDWFWNVPKVALPAGVTLADLGHHTEEELPLRSPEEQPAKFNRDLYLETPVWPGAS